MINQEAIEILKDLRRWKHPSWLEKDIRQALDKGIEALEDQKTGHCKDCKWWKDSDGVYRRDCYTESQCPINRREVFESNGYCYMFESKESENRE